MSGEKASNADNQQERIKTYGWIVGFVDGEGSFLINIFKSPRARLGWQIFPEFNVSQTKKDLNLLKELKKFFDCGHIYIHRTRIKEKERWDVLYKYCVRARNELREKIIPFFKEYPPRSVNKKKDFEKFVRVVNLMEEGRHLTVGGMRRVARIVETMSHRKPFSLSQPSKFLSSSETIRRDSKDL